MIPFYKDSKILKHRKTFPSLIPIRNFMRTLNFLNLLISRSALFNIECEAQVYMLFKTFVYYIKKRNK